jgi:hypothetical protein
MQWFEMAGLSVILVALLASVLAITLRWFRHRERLAMIRQGLIPDDAGAPVGSRTRKRRGLLFGGLSIAALGLLLLCAAFWVAVPAVTAATPWTGLSSVGLVPLPGLLVAFMGVGLLILYVWAQPTVERRARAAAGVQGTGAIQDAELAELEEIEPVEPEIESWEVPVPEEAPPSTADADASTLDVKAPPEQQT